MLPIHAYQCGQKMKSIYLETTYFSGMVCPVGVWLPPKCMSCFRFISLIFRHIFSETAVQKKDFYWERASIK